MLPERHRCHNDAALAATQPQDGVVGGFDVLSGWAGRAGTALAVNAGAAAL
jgi:hypothetical protein